MNKDERKTVLDLIMTYDRYVDLLGDELKRIAPYMLVHSMSFKEKAIEDGMKAREKIEALKKTMSEILVKGSQYDQIADLISRIFFYGKFKAETVNERRLEQLLTEVELWPTTEDEILKRPKIDEIN